MMKNSSTYAAAKGTTPVKHIPSIGFKKGGGVGIARAMVLVTVGNSRVSCLYPKYAPKNTNGMDTQHHIAPRMMISNKGALPADLNIHKIMLKNKKTQKAIPG